MNKFISLLVAGVLAVAGYIALVSLYLPVSQPLEKADAIIAVSGGDTAARAQHAIELYQEGWAPKLVFSGAAKDPKSASNARVMLALAVARGVPTKDIQLDETSRDTKENASLTASIAGNYKTIILVTSDYHQRRVNKEFRQAYGESTTFINSPSPDKFWNRKTWFLTPQGWWISSTEVLKLLV